MIHAWVKDILYNTFNNLVEAKHAKMYYKNSPLPWQNIINLLCDDLVKFDGIDDYSFSILLNMKIFPLSISLPQAFIPFSDDHHGNNANNNGNISLWLSVSMENNVVKEWLLVN